MTANELQTLHEESRHDLLDGVLRRRPYLSFFAGVAGGALAAPPASYVSRHDLGRVVMAAGFQLAVRPDTVLAPQIAFVSASRLNGQEDLTGCLQAAPDLAVEVLSPGDTYEEVEDRTSRYLAAGTHLVWVVRPVCRRIEVHRANGESLFLTEKEALDGEDVVPGFSLPLARIFH